MKRFLMFSSLAILLILLGVDVYYISDRIKNDRIKAIVIQKEAPPTRQVTFVPTKIIIPALSLEADVEPEGVTKAGNMDVPANWNKTGWYALGYHPGENGNAVIAGHVDNNLGLPAVFYYIKDLKPGNEIILLDKNGNKQTFAVDTSEAVSVVHPPLERIFGPSDAPHLNLITCTGPWNKKTRSYDERMVVYSTLKRLVSLSSL